MPTGDTEIPITRERARASIIAALGGRGLRGGQHPEVRDTLGVVLHALHALEAPAPQRSTKTSQVLAEHDWLSRNIKAFGMFATNPLPTDDQAWALADSLRTVWIATATDDEMAVALTGQPSPPPSLTGSEQTRLWLHHRHVNEQATAARERAQAQLRTRYLSKAGLILAVLVAAAWIAAVLTSRQVGIVSLCGLAGAIGGAVHGARGVRDSRKLTDTQTFQTWWWVQPLVGSAVGLFVFALLSSPVLTLPGSTSDNATSRAAAFVVYAFLAGFSEPWLLGIMDRIGGVADRAAKATSSTTDSAGHVTP
jgi:hypothetical protein